MRTFTLLFAIIIAMLFTGTLKASDVDSTKVIKKMIKTIEIDEDGKTIIDSTVVYEGDEVNVFIRKMPEGQKGRKMIEKHIIATQGKDAKWVSDDEMEFDITVETDGDSSKVIVMKSGDGRMKEFKFDGDDMKKHKMMMFQDGNLEEDIHFAPHAEHLMLKKENSRLIDLNDPKIISFEKETLKNGNEKITIIRKPKK